MSALMWRLAAWLEDGHRQRAIRFNTHLSTQDRCSGAVSTNRRSKLSSIIDKDVV